MLKELRTSLALQQLEEVRDVPLDRTFRAMDRCGDLQIVKPSCDQPKHFEFSPRKRGEQTPIGLNQVFECAGGRRRTGPAESRHQQRER